MISLYELEPPLGFVAGEELGVLFDIERLGTGSYGSKAWSIVCSSVRPMELQPYCYFFFGDVEIAVGDRPYSYCIGIGVDLPMSNDGRPLAIFAEKLWTIDNPGLARRPRRFLRGSNVRQTHGLIKGMVLVRDRITVADMSTFGHLLKIAEDAGWGRRK